MAALGSSLLLQGGHAVSMFAGNEDRERPLQLLLIFSKLSLVSLFGISAIMKARDLGTLVSHVTLTMSLGNRLARSLAQATVAMELIAVGLLLTSPIFGYVISLLLLVCFTVHLSRVIASGVATSCACAGSSESRVSVIHLIRNGILIGLTAAWSSRDLTRLLRDIFDATGGGRSGFSFRGCHALVG